jgi:hypothetical protein
MVTSPMNQPYTFIRLPLGYRIMTQNLPIITRLYPAYIWHSRSTANVAMHLELVYVGTSDGYRRLTAACRGCNHTHFPH